ncbi:MAG: hypothetical protein SPH19_07050, partial [Sodaliphilus sp.]|nr:hypothetical protein [Sodaliphilus sp.]
KKNPSAPSAPSAPKNPPPQNPPQKNPSAPSCSECSQKPLHHKKGKKKIATRQAGSNHHIKQLLSLNQKI